MDRSEPTPSTTVMPDSLPPSDPSSSASAVAQESLVLALPIKVLSRPDNLRGAFKTLFYFGCLGALAFAIYRVQSWPLRLVYQVILGLVFAHGLELQHECLHGLMFRRRSICRFFGVLFGLPMTVSFTHYQMMHLHHHKYLGTDKDQELFDYDAHSLTSWPRFFRRAWNLSRIPAFFATLYGLLRGRYPAVFSNLRVRARVRREYVGIALLLVGAVTYTVVTRNWLLVQLWFVPWLLFGEPWHFMIELPEHIGCDKKSQDFLLNTRSVIAPRFIQYLVNMNNFHVEHHSYPSVAMHRLELVHEAMQGQQQHLSPSYRKFYGEILSSIGPQWR
jgi:fatty acid desaturase